ncbi:2Fe-2S iron-sulfur cluster-binding protein [Pelagerythrobacter aerophilus]
MWLLKLSRFPDTILFSRKCNAEIGMIVQVKPIRRIVQCDEGEGLLDVLLREGLPISYSCKTGNCGMCEVEPFDLFAPDRHKQSVLMQKNKAFLACQRNISMDMGVRLPSVRPAVNVPFQYHRGRITALEEIETNVIQFDFDIGRRPARFFPGQKYALAMDRGRSPLLFPANAPGQSTLSFLVEADTAPQFLVELKKGISAGQEFKLVGPIGKGYVLPQDEAAALVCGVGPGMVAVRSIVEALIAQNPNRAVQFLLQPSDSFMHLVDGICNLCTQHLPNSELVVFNGPQPKASMRLTSRRGSTTEMIDFIQLERHRIKAEQANVFAPGFAVLPLMMSLMKAGLDQDAIFFTEAEINFAEEEGVNVS